MRRTLMSVLAAMAVASVAGGASAQLNVNALAAGVAIPFNTTTGGISTEAVITNGAASGQQLHFDLLNGDPGEAWEIQSWDCFLTARETVKVSFTNDGNGGSTVTFECDLQEGTSGPPYAGNDGNVNSFAERGVLWVTVQNAQTGQTLPSNVLFADFTFVDTSTGEASSAPAAGFQGSQNNGDKVYEFNTTEYAEFPAVLATNYLPPATWGGTLLVYTLDGLPGVAPQVRARGFWYNDDEDSEDFALTFKCMDFLDYSDIHPGLGALNTAGHMSLAAVVDGGFLDSPIDDTKRPLLCYNLQDAPQGGTTMRACAQSTASFTPLQNDTVELDGQLPLP